MSRGEECHAAAGVAALLGSHGPEEVLALANKTFMYIAANKLQKEDMAEKTPNPELARLAKKGHLGSVDAFVSHSWSDSPELKWQALQQWCSDFKLKNRREPKLWIDKYCIDQNNIEESLACLPVFLAGCTKLLILCGKTYLQRLWCLIEIMVFLEMGGDTSNLEIKVIDGAKITAARGSGRASGNHTSQSMQNALEVFDPRDARCFTEEDTRRLQAVVEIIGYDRIGDLVHGAFMEALENQIQKNTDESV